MKMEQVERIIDEADQGKSRCSKHFSLAKMLTSTQINEIKPIQPLKKPDALAIIRFEGIVEKK